MAGGGLGFGAGFSEGIANALLTSRQREREDADKATARQDKLFGTLLPIMVENAEDPADIEAFIRQQYPDLDGKGGKKGESRIAKIGKALAPFIGLKRQPVGNDLPEQGGITGNLPTGTPRGALPAGITFHGGQPLPATLPPAQQPPGVTGGTINALGQQGVLTPGQTVQPVAQDVSDAEGNAIINRPETTSFFGVRMLTPEAKASRALNAQINVSVEKMNKARTVVLPALRAVEPNATIYDALEVLGINIDNPAKRTANAPMMGVDREAISWWLYHKRFIDLTSDEAGVVIQEEQKQLNTEAKQRALGTGQGRFESPITIDQSQSSGLPTGTRSSDVSGQTVQPLAMADQRRSLDALKQDLTRVTALLNVLPSEKEAAGVAPGGVLAVRRRMNSPSSVLGPDGKTPMSYREAIASMESIVDGMASQLARVKAGQRGAQTERDADRAYNAVINLQKGLTDLFGGDTRESAAARIRETTEGIDRVLAGLPTQAVPTKPAAGAAAEPAGRGAGPRGAGGGPNGRQGGSAPATPTTTGPVWDTKTGKLLVNGVPIN